MLMIVLNDLACVVQSHRNSRMLEVPVKRIESSIMTSTECANAMV